MRLFHGPHLQEIGTMTDSISIDLTSEPTARLARAQHLAKALRKQARGKQIPLRETINLLIADANVRMARDDVRASTSY